MKSLWIFLLFFLPLSGWSQDYLKGWENIRLTPNGKDTIDRSRMNAHYRQIVRKDTLYPDEYKIVEMFLQMGEKSSKYMDYIRFISDSIYTREYQMADISNLELRRRSLAREAKHTDFTYIYKNYPPHKLLVQDAVLFDRYYYEEDIPYFGWELQTDTLRILDFLCYKAVCNFRGRQYTAWYSPDIPVNNGPWKFCGLPGLILKVSDSRGDYDFECTAFYRVDWYQPIYRNLRTSEYKTTREKFLSAKRAGMANVGFMVENSGKVTSPDGIKPVKSLPYNPMELDE